MEVTHVTHTTKNVLSTTCQLSYDEATNQPMCHLTSQPVQSRTGARKGSIRPVTPLHAAIGSSRKHLQPLHALSSRSTTPCRPTTAPCSATRRPASQCSSRADPVQVTTHSARRQDSANSRGRSQAPASVGLRVSSALTRSNSQNWQLQVPSNSHSLDRGASRPNTAPSAATSAGQAICDPSQLLGLQEHHSAFLRAWHGRIQNSIQQQQTGPISRPNSAPGTHFFDARGSSRVTSRPVTRHDSSNTIQQQLQHLHPEALNDLALQTAVDRSNFDISRVSLPTAAAALARQHASAVGFNRSAPHDTAAQADRATGGPSNSIIGAAAQQWLQDHSMPGQHIRSGVAGADQRMFQRIQELSLAANGRTAQQQYQYSYQHSSWPTTADSDWRQEAAAVGHAANSASGNGITSRQQGRSEQNVPQQTTETIVDPGLLAVYASELLDKCTVQSSKKVVETCSICLDDIAVNELAPLLMCGHILHHSCLVRWLGQRLLGQLSTSSSKVEVMCPVCKQVSVDRQLLAVV